MSSNHRAAHSLFRLSVGWLVCWFVGRIRQKTTERDFHQNLEARWVSAQNIKKTLITSGADPHKEKEPAFWLISHGNKARIREIKSHLVGRLNYGSAVIDGLNRKKTRSVTSDILVALNVSFWFVAAIKKKRKKATQTPPTASDGSRSWSTAGSQSNYFGKFVWAGDDSNVSLKTSGHINSVGPTTSPLLI